MDGMDADEDTSVIDSLEGIVSPQFEVLSIKIVIAAHLLGAKHRTIQEQIKMIIDACWDTKLSKVKETCDEFATLIWLDSMGIDVIGLGRAKIAY